MEGTGWGALRDAEGKAGMHGGCREGSSNTGKDMLCKGAGRAESYWGMQQRRGGKCTGVMLQIWGLHVWMGGGMHWQVQRCTGWGNALPKRGIHRGCAAEAAGMHQHKQQTGWWMHWRDTAESAGNVPKHVDWTAGMH